MRQLLRGPAGRKDGAIGGERCAVKENFGFLGGEVFSFRCKILNIIFMWLEIIPGKERE